MQPQQTTVPSLQTMAGCRRVSFPAVNGDRMRVAKAIVDKAVKEKKVFSIEGSYPVIRAFLRARGWVERRLPRRSTRVQTFGLKEAEGVDDTDSSNDYSDDRGQDGDKEDDTDMHDIMSRLVRNETSYLYWTTKRDTVNYMSLLKDQMTNHYRKSGSFTTKVGLCMSLRNLHWFDSTDPDTFFPRCYCLAAEDEKQAFTEDFRRTACTSLLRYVVETAKGQEEGDTGGNFYQIKQSKALYKQYKHQALKKVGAELIEMAVHVCQEYLSSLDHCDIDVSLETPPTFSEQQWTDFIYKYYLVVHDGVEIEGCTKYVEHCRSMLNQMQTVCPQLKTDGVSNIWIIKPGAKSRGRDIVCKNRLEEMLSLVDSDPALIKDSKWVVQKYIERPLLIHGTKFDLRQWFLVTDWNPLTVWFYQECYLRFSTQVYSTHSLDSSVHLCNNSIQRHFQPSACRNPLLPADNMWSSTQFRSWLAASGRGRLWEEVVLPGMRKAVIHTLLTVQDSVEPRKASFELYGADFLLGCDLHPWLLEVNASPTMALSTAVTARLCPAVLEDTLRVVLDRRYDRNAHTGGFHLLYKQAPVEVPQYVGVSLPVEGVPIRHPCSFHSKTLIQSQHQPKSALPNCMDHSGKENQSNKEKTWSAVPPKKVTIEKSFFLQPLLEKRLRRLTLSSSHPHPNPFNHDHQTYTHLHIRNRQALSQTDRRKRNVLSLSRVNPSLEILSTQPELTLTRTSTNVLKHPKHIVRVSQPVLKMHQYFPQLHDQNTETYIKKGPYATRIKHIS